MRSLSVLSSLVVTGFAVALTGCGEESESATAPSPGSSVEAAVAATVSFTQVSAGAEHTCALASGGKAYCWGSNSHGQLGVGTFGSSSTPKAVAGGLVFAQVSAGQLHSCGVTTQNRLYCWGELYGGTPVHVGGDRRFVNVRAGTMHTCAVNPSNVGFCWGSERFGELGTQAGSNPFQPNRVVGGLSFRRVVAGGGVTCGVTTTNKAYCWGWAGDGALGAGIPHLNSSKPVAVLGGLSFSSVIPGGGQLADAQGMEMDEAHTCGVTTDNRGYCWGANTYGMLGIGGGGSTSTPTAVAGGLRFRQVIAGYRHSCGVTTANVAYCWGDNFFGELGIAAGVGAGVSTPAKVAGGLQFAGVSIGPVGLHSCGITTTNRVYCWGHNGFGQLGDGTTTLRPTPVLVAGQS